MARNTIDIPYGDGVLVTPSDTTNFALSEQGDGLQINCTVAGNVSLVMSSGNVVPWTAAAGSTLLPYRVKRVNVTGTTATATYYRMT